MKRFSVVVPVRNPDPDRMRHALASIRMAQIIIVDDASDEVDAPLRLGDEFGAALYREETECGLVAAVNYGISRASGEYIHVLPTDCYVLNGFYQTVDLLIRTHGFRSMVATRWLESDEDGRVVEAFTEEIPEVGKTPWPACAFVARRDWYEENPWTSFPSPDKTERWDKFFFSGKEYPYQQGLLEESASEVVRMAASNHLLANWPMVCVPKRPISHPGVLTL